jgi:hypothetical protein
MIYTSKVSLGLIVQCIPPNPTQISIQSLNALNMPPTMIWGLVEATTWSSQCSISTKCRNKGNPIGWYEPTKPNRQGVQTKCQQAWIGYHSYCCTLLSGSQPNDFRIKLITAQCTQAHKKHAHTTQRSLRGVSRASLHSNHTQKKDVFTD